MIVPTEFVKNLDKRVMAEFATNYCNSFAHRVGYHGGMEIEPHEIIYNPKEAKRYFLEPLVKKYMKASDPEEKNVILARYSMLRKAIKRKDPFVEDGVAYVPASDITEGEANVVSLFCDCWRSDRFARWIGIDSSFMRFFGFGGEMGHVAGKKMYGDRAEGGMGEACDMFSQMHNVSYNVFGLASLSSRDDIDPEAVIKEALENKLNNHREDFSVRESLVFDGPDAALQRALEVKIWDGGSASGKLLLNHLTEDYIITSHFGGLKIFYDVLDSQDGDMEKAFKRFNVLMTAPGIDDTYEMVAAIGVSDVKKYEGLFEKKPIVRAKEMERRMQKFKHGS